VEPLARALSGPDASRLVWRPVSRDRSPRRQSPGPPRSGGAIFGARFWKTRFVAWRVARLSHPVQCRRRRRRRRRHRLRLRRRSGVVLHRRQATVGGTNARCRHPRVPNRLPCPIGRLCAAVAVAAVAASPFLSSRPCRARSTGRLSLVRRRRPHPSTWSHEPTSHRVLCRAWANAHVRVVVVCSLRDAAAAAAFAAVSTALRARCPPRRHSRSLPPPFLVLVLLVLVLVLVPPLSRGAREMSRRCPFSACHERSAVATLGFSSRSARRPSPPYGGRRGGRRRRHHHHPCRLPGRGVDAPPPRR